MNAIIPSRQLVHPPTHADYHLHAFAEFRGKHPCTRRLMIDVEPGDDGFDVVVRGEDKLLGSPRAARIWNTADGTARRFVVATYQSEDAARQDVAAVVCYFLAAREFILDRVARLTTAGAVALARVIERGVGVAPWAATAGKVGSFADLGVDRRVRRVKSVKRSIATLAKQPGQVEDVETIVDAMMAKVPLTVKTEARGPVFVPAVEDVRDAQAIRPHFSKAFLARCSTGDAQALTLKAKVEREYRQQVESWRRRIARQDTMVRSTSEAPTIPTAGDPSIDAQAEREGAAIDQQELAAAERRMLLHPVRRHLPGLGANRGDQLDPGNRVIFAGAYRRHDATLAWLRILDREAWKKTTFRPTINPTRSDKQDRERRRLRRELGRSLLTLRDHVDPEQIGVLVNAGPRAVIIAAERLAVTI